MPAKYAVVGLRELRERTDTYIAAVQNGASFLVMRRSKPVFKLVPPGEDDALWEPVIDFTRVKKGGVRIAELLSRLPA